jgi:GWxTD domain-containing protein
MNLPWTGRSTILGLLLVALSLPLAAAQNAPRKEIPPAYRKWLNEDVVWIITDEERADFKKLTTDEQREEFVTAFWERRNPNPSSAENKFKEEHYRRIAYANTHFAFDLPGWITDRGRIFITYGPPDSVERHAKFTPPIEIWHYESIEGCSNITLTFTDKNGGDYFLNDADADWIRQMREAR